VKDGKFHVALLDWELKPVGLSEQTLTATSGYRAKPENSQLKR
jgi:hypothetical protein